MEKTLLSHKINIVEYTVAPFFMNNKKSGFHQWLIEFKNPPNDLMKFKKELDINLQNLNTDYKSKIEWQNGVNFIANTDIRCKIYLFFLVF